jgi:sRNA-binding regulator protein Hfq
MHVAPAPPSNVSFSQGGLFPMSSRAILSPSGNFKSPRPSQVQARFSGNMPAPVPFRFPARTTGDEALLRHAELFYLQKQIQAQTPMVIVMEDGERIEGCIEWYDRQTLKVRGHTKTLIYKTAIKYMHKLGDPGR